jgi:hypothetical protein
MKFSGTGRDARHNFCSENFKFWINHEFLAKLQSNYKFGLCQIFKCSGIRNQQFKFRFEIETLIPPESDLGTTKTEFSAIDLSSL